MRLLGRWIAAFAGLYILVFAVVLALMFQPPTQFARFISRVPVPAIVPFPQLWSFARAGHLKQGDRAPDFDLLSLDQQSRIRLSSFRGYKPVVLIFGSYT